MPLPMLTRSRAAAVLLAAGLAGWPATAWAHPGQPLQPHDAWTAWNLDPTLLLGLALAAGLFARGWPALRARQPERWRAAAFAGAWLALVIALVSPLDRAASALFSAHMAQHMLLIVVAAPLLALSAPLAPMLLALPRPWQAALGRGWQQAGPLRRAWDALTRPATAWVVHTAVLWLWHVPSAYTAALQVEWLHRLEHLTMLGSALLVWWVVVHPARRHAGLRGPGGTLYIFTQAMQSGLLGALLTVSTVAWYPAYAATTAPWGLSAVEDQQLAGAIMWVPAGLVYLAAALVILGLWLQAAEHRETSPALTVAAHEPGREG